MRRFGRGGNSIQARNDGENVDFQAKFISSVAKIKKLKQYHSTVDFHRIKQINANKTLKPR